MFKKMSAATKLVVQESLRVARTLEHQCVIPEHLLLGLFAAPDTAPATALLSLGVTSAEGQAWLAAQYPPGSLPVTASSALRGDTLTILRRANTHDPVEVTDLAVTLLQDGSPGVTAMLAALGVTAGEVIAEMGTHAETAPPQAQPAPKNAVEYARDLVAAAATGELDPVVGRDQELARVSQVLARRSKNNPVLVGDPGVGKTAVVEALAHNLAHGAVPKALRGRPLWQVDLGGMLAGARYRGDFEARLKTLLAAAQDSHAILFLDELHTIVGTGAASDSTLDAAQMLKESLARGAVTILGATTVKEYRKHITSDPALERRFTQVEVAEPTVSETEAILSQLAPRYADHHGVTYTRDALAAAAKLADRHIRGRFNPDKAIDVIDEAGSRLASEHVDDTEQADVVGPDLVAAVVAQIAGIPVGTVTVDERASLLHLEDRLASRVVGQGPAVSAVARAIRRRRSGITGAARPASFLFAGPTGVGKTELAKALADTLFADARTGRGKLVRFDMSEFADKHTVARLFGAPPGYVGYSDGGQLTEAVLRHPASVVLLDEVDKAHPDVFDALLQVLDDGRMTDGQGRVVSFADTVVILTTNFGARESAKTPTGFLARADHAASVTRKALKDSFRPEFLNRLDEILVFDKLGPDMVSQVARNMVDEVVVRALEAGVSLTVTDDAIAALVTEGTSDEYGVRPLRRTVERRLADPVAEAVIAETGTFLVADAGPDGMVTVHVSQAEDQPVIEARA